MPLEGPSFPRSFPNATRPVSLVRAGLGPVSPSTQPRVSSSPYLKGGILGNGAATFQGGRQPPNAGALREMIKRRRKNLGTTATMANPMGEMVTAQSRVLPNFVNNSTRYRAFGG